jgi:magnesium transporter
MVVEQRDLEKFKELVENGELEEFQKKAEEVHPHDLAELIQKLDPPLRNRVLANLKDELLIKILPELAEDAQLEFVEVISPDLAAKLLAKIPPDDMVDVLGDLSMDSRRNIVSYFSKEKTTEAKKLLRYAEDTAGGLMTTEVVALPENVTVEKAIEHIRKKAKEFEAVYYIYVVDNKRRLMGVLSLRELVLAPPRAELKDVMNREIIKVHADMDQEELAYIIADYDLVAVPVVDKEDRLLGMVTVDDVLDVIEEEVTEDMAHLSGTAPKIDRLINASASDVVKARLPWLIFALIGDGLVASYVLKTFEGTLASVVALALFIPVIMTMGGNVGIQSSTVFVRGIATGEIEKPLKYFAREIKIGIIMGLLVGLGVSLFAQLLIGKPNIGLVVGVAMFCTMTLASITGVVIPQIFNHIGIDPAISSSPFITTTQDIFGLSIYFGLASIMLKHLL